MADFIQKLTVFVPHTTFISKYFYLSLKICLSMVLFLHVIKALRRHLDVLKWVDDLPSLKLKCWDLLGHAQLLYNHRLKKISKTSMHIHDFQAMCGYGHLFAREGLAGLSFGYEFLMLFRAETVESILNSNKEIKKAWFYDSLKPWLGTSVLLSHGRKWKAQRKLLTPIFHFDILKNYVPVMNKYSKVLNDAFEFAVQKEFVDIVPIIRDISFDIICECVLDKALSDQFSESYIPIAKELTSAATERIHNPWFWNDNVFKLSTLGRNFSKTVQAAHNFVNKIISEKRNLLLGKLKKYELRDDDSHLDDSTDTDRKRSLVHLLLREHLKDNSFSETDVREELETFIFAGHDTTSATMNWCLWLVGLHPWVQDTIHRELDAIFGEDDRDASLEDLKDMKYLECVIKETLRLYPSVPMLARKLDNAIYIRNYRIPEGCTCVINSFLLHRDPDVFSDPERFDPDRFSPQNSAGRHSFAYVPFSAGPRNCLGQKFASLELKTVLSTVLRKYKFRSLDPRDKVDIWMPMILRPTKGLRLQVRRRDQNFDFPSVFYFSQDKKIETLH